MQKPYWIIEHPNRGVYVGAERYGNGPDWNKLRPRFRWSILRNEGMVFHSAGEARKVWEAFESNLKHKTYVIRLGNPDHGPVMEFK